MVQKSGQPLEFDSLSDYLQGFWYIPHGQQDFFHQQYYSIMPIYQLNILKTDSQNDL